MCHPIQLFSNKVAVVIITEHQMNAPKKFHPQKLQKRISAPPAIGPATKRALVTNRAKKTT
jgi:hypothetical protein